MHEVFDEEDFKPGEHRRDTEVTLGPILLLCLFFGLVLLCGLCFGLGYSMGSHGAHNASAAVQQPDAEAALPTAGSSAKPSATPQVLSQPQGAASDLSATDATDAAAAGAQNTGVMPASNANSASQPVVRPALPAAATSAPAYGQPAPAPKTASTSALMVQIAVVSHQEDADVLVGALQRRGYAVTVHRDAADGQFHVRIGPFSNRNDAYATRQKLLNDGYNAVVQQ
jgi:cell division septation protein DedD